MPNLNWAGDTSRPRYFQVRGIGELQQYQGAPNPSVGFLIDDIDFSGLGTAATLFDLDHVEVLRGPQGTLYGANALAGLIVVKSAAPADTFGGRVELDAGDYGERSYGAVITGPVNALDSAFRLAVQRYTSDGFYHNAYLAAATPTIAMSSPCAADGATTRMTPCASHAHIFPGDFGPAPAGCDPAAWPSVEDGPDPDTRLLVNGPMRFPAKRVVRRGTAP